MDTDMLYYREWYTTEVKPNLTTDEKEGIVRKISEISLRQPIQTARIKIDHSEIPELERFSNAEKFTGRQLFVVMKEMFGELYGG